MGPAARFTEAISGKACVHSDMTPEAETYMITRCSTWRWRRRGGRHCGIFKGLELLFQRLEPDFKLQAIYIL